MQCQWTKQCMLKTLLLSFQALTDWCCPCQGSQEKAQCKSIQLKLTDSQLWDLLVFALLKDTLTLQLVGVADQCLSFNSITWSLWAGLVRCLLERFNWIIWQITQAGVCYRPPKKSAPLLSEIVVASNNIGPTQFTTGSENPLWQPKTNEWCHEFGVKPSQDLYT